MNFRPRSSASGDSSFGGPQHLGADSFDCRPERYEIVAYYCLIETLLKACAVNDAIRST